MMTLMFNVVVKERIRAIYSLNCKEILLSADNNCTRVTYVAVTEEEGLTSDQEEADTKLALHCLHACHC